MNKTVLCRERVSENLLNRVVYRAAECCTLAPTCVSFFECSAQRAWKSTQGFASSVFFGGVFITRYVPIAACLLAMLANKEVPRYSFRKLPRFPLAGGAHSSNASKNEARPEAADYLII